MAIDRDQSPLVDGDTQFTYAQSLLGERGVVKLSHRQLRPPRSMDGESPLESSI